MSNLNEMSKENLILEVNKYRSLVSDIDIQIRLLKAKLEELNLAIAIKNGRIFGKQSEVIEKEKPNLFNFNELDTLSTSTLEEEIKEIKQPIKTRKQKSKNHANIDLSKYVTKIETHYPDGVTTLDESR